LNGGLQRFLEGHRLRGDHVLERAALDRREDRRVERLFRIRPFARMMPPRGPRSVLCVVLVTKSAMPTGEG